MGGYRWTSVYRFDGPTGRISHALPTSPIAPADGPLRPLSITPRHHYSPAHPFPRAPMQALLVIDAQNEFSPPGLPPAPNPPRAIAAIHRHVRLARDAGRPIAWIQHHNRPTESRAFVPGS